MVKDVVCLCICVSAYGAVICENQKGQEAVCRAELHVFLEGFPLNGINPDIEKRGRSDISLADSSLDWKFLWLVCFTHCCLSHSVMLGEIGC